MSKPARKQVAARAKELREAIDFHSYRYHVLDDPEVADAEYDALVGELMEIEAAYPDLVTPDSPTQRVGAPPSDLFAPVRHRNPMMSLDNCFSLEELLAWGKRVERAIGTAGAFVTELKMDGVAVNLIYEDGVFVKGSTGHRGPRRGLHAHRRLREAEHEAGGAGSQDLRKPSQRGGRLPAPEGP